MIAGFSFAAAFIIIFIRKYLSSRKVSLLNLVVIDDKSKIYGNNKKFVSEIEIMANNFRYRARSRHETRTAMNTVGEVDIEYGSDRNSDAYYYIDDSKEEVTDFVEQS